MPTPFQEQIKILVELQKVDAEVHGLKKELSLQPAEEKRLADDFEKKKASLKAAEADLKTTQLKQKEKEGELGQKEEKVKKLQGQLYQLKTNKEYSAMELEIKGLQADDSLLEEDILRLIDAVDESKAKVAKEKEALAVLERDYKEQVDVLKKRAAELTAQVAELEDKRKAYTPNIDVKILSQYERVMKRDGIGIVPVKKNSCGGCRITLPPQTVNEMQMNDKLIMCEECARILYWAP